MKDYKTTYSNTTKELRFWYRVFAEMLDDGEKQVFRTYILQDWKIKGDKKILYLKTRREPSEYVDNFLKEVEEREKEI